MTKLTRAKLARGFVSLLNDHSAKELTPLLAREIVQSGLVNQLDLVLLDVSRELLRQTGHLEVDVVAAHKLTEEIRDHLTRLVKHETGATQVTLNQRIDRSVVGGVLARTPELELNITIEAKLRRLTA